MGRHKTVPSAACALGHAGTTIHARGTRTTRKGTVRVFSCVYVEDGETKEHKFSVLDVPVASTGRQLIDEAVPIPACPRKGHEGRIVRVNGTYDTLAGPRQRYRCFTKDDPEGTKHTFTTPLPRSAVAEDTCCDDCHVLTPKNAGSEAPARYSNYPVGVIFSVLRDLSEGRAYTHASMRALEQMERPPGRSRRLEVQASDGTRVVKTPQMLNEAGDVGPARDQKAHWHIATDILERFGPVITEAAFAKMAEEEAQYRAASLPVVYIADEVDVRRDYATSKVLTSSAVVWNALVISRTRWERDDDGVITGRSSRLMRFRALPTRTKESWTLVMGELDAPDFLVCDGAAAIHRAAQDVWGASTTVVPCVHHATEAISRNLAPKGQKLPEKVRDHLFLLTRDLMAASGPAVISPWFDELEALAASADLSVAAVALLRETYQPLLERSAAVAQANPDPPVPISNAAVEGQILAWVKKVTSRRGAMFSNLARTNLLGDLVVAGSNGALLRQHQVATALRDASRGTGGWAPPPRALNEPVGVMGLRDPGSVTQLLAQLTAGGES